MKNRAAELFQVVVSIIFLCSCISIGQPVKRTENNNTIVLSLAGVTEEHSDAQISSSEQKIQADNTAAPADAPVTGLPVDYSTTQMEEIVDPDGVPCIAIKMTAKPGDTVTIVLPNQDDYVVQNNEASDVPYQLTIPKSCYFPNTPLTDSVYTVTPQILVAHADGTWEPLHVDSFTITFPTIQMELSEPSEADFTEEGVMATEGNELILKGKVDDHTVSVAVNGQAVAIYEDGYFEYTYSMTADEAETVIIEANKANCVSASYSFTVMPYVLIPEKMPLTEANRQRSFFKAPNEATASPEPTNKELTTKSVYYSAITLTKRDLEKHYTDKGIRYYYRGIPLSDKENEFINAKYNKSGAVNQTAMYEAMAELLSGFGLGRASGNNWDSYAEVFIGYIPSTRDEMIPYVKNAIEFIVPSDKASEVASAIMHKIETIPEASGKFDYKNGAYEVEISDLTKCANQMMISEEMLGYILADLNAMGAKISFNKNSCSISLTVKTWGSLF